MKRNVFARMCSILIFILVFTIVPVRSAAATAPARVKNFRLICHGNKSAFLAWNQVKNASYYIVYRYDEAQEKYIKDKKTTSTYCQVKNLNVGEKYRFAVKSFRSLHGSTMESDYSRTVEVTGKKINLKEVHGRYWEVKTKRTVKAENLATGKTITVKKGMSGETKSRHSKMATIKLKNGKTVRMKRSNLSYGNLAMSKSYKKYSRAQAEAFVNQKGYSSNTDWLIWISQYTGSVHIFKGGQGKWKRQRVAECIVGKYGHTPIGTFRLIKREGGYKTYFTWNRIKEWGNSFHSRIDANTRGALSLGCVRLGYDDLVYLTKNCPLGTTVISY